MSKRGSRKTTSAPILSGNLKKKVLEVMNCLGGDNFACYNIDKVNVGTERAKIKFYMKVLVRKSNRDLATNQVIAELTKNNITYIRDDYVIDVPLDPSDAAAGDKIRLEVKPTQGGSGAGAVETAKNESAQALFCALRWSRSQDLTLNNWSFEDLQTVYNANCDLNPTSLWSNDIEVLLTVNPKWIESHVKGANLIYSHINSSGKSYTFHRGSSLVKQIEKTFSRCDKAYPGGKNFSDLNKWSPADIYIVSNDFLSSGLSQLVESPTLEVLNQRMQEYFDSKDLIGISLKKIETGNGRWSVKNHKNIPKDVSQVMFRGLEGTFKSIDIYVKWGPAPQDRIQFRNTGSSFSWQGEIKGLSAAQGKIGGGIVDGYVEKLFPGKSLGVKSGNTTLKTKTHPTGASVSDRKNVTDEIFDMCKSLKSPGFLNDFVDDPQTKVNISLGTPDPQASKAESGHSWRYSKYIGLKLAKIINGLNSEQKDKLVRAWYYYAASQSDLSAVYAKVE
jgi:hypothetical protein